MKLSLDFGLQLCVGHDRVLLSKIIQNGIFQLKRAARKL